MKWERIFTAITEVIGWLQIAVLPTAVGIIVGLIVYNHHKGIAGLLVGCLLAFIGLLVGIFWATRVWKKHGTVWFLSRVTATPELDDKEASTQEDRAKK